MNTQPAYDQCTFSPYTDIMQDPGLEATIWLIRYSPLQICGPIIYVSTSMLKISLCMSFGSIFLTHAHARIIHLKQDKMLPS